jgi:hypothetical protein
MDARRSMPFS